MSDVERKSDGWYNNYNTYSTLRQIELMSCDRNHKSAITLALYTCIGLLLKLLITQCFYHSDSTKYFWSFSFTSPSPLNRSTHSWCVRSQWRSREKNAHFCINKYVQSCQIIQVDDNKITRTFWESNKLLPVIPSDYRYFVTRSWYKL